MMSQTLQLANALNKDNAAQLTRTLESIRGLSSIAFAPATNRIHVTFDEDHTSLQELVTAINKAGYEIDREQRGKTEGGCCGGCCS
ncbi:heavy-metal-associated domain-containing protein [Noviherbaspirillum sp. Root189]|uniref:heavy-metal-associated domain-containing protein n=1 Tax=Noviherbaspirillum sp. Root189 TaxID=1736487 RepID=UPI00070EDDEC|nr:cation transporter [Noviherbaspirillum sp. Root189]